MKFLSSLKKIKTDSRGDTIIEVLIAMAILALVLGTAYAISSQSLKTGTSAGQRSRALGYAQSQIEFVKQAQATSPALMGQYTYYDPARSHDDQDPFCVTPDGAFQRVPADADASHPCNSYEGFYTVRSSYGGDPALPDYQVFSIHVWWASANLSGEQNHLVLYYKLPGSVDTPPTVNLVALPSSVSNGGSSDLTWSTTNAISCMASGGWSGAKLTGGTEQVGPLSFTTTYTLTCDGPGGSASDSETITVTNPPSPPPSPSPSPPPPSPSPSPPPPSSGCPNPQSGDDGSNRPNACVRSIVSTRTGPNSITFRIWASHCYSGLSVSYPGNSQTLSWIASPSDNSAEYDYSVSNASSSSGTATATCSGNGTSWGDVSVSAWGQPSPPPPSPPPITPPPPVWETRTVCGDPWAGEYLHDGGCTPEERNFGYITTLACFRNGQFDHWGGC